MTLPLRASRAPFRGRRGQIGQAGSAVVAGSALRRAVAAALLVITAMAPAHAALFGDDEARKAILDLRQRVAAQEEANKAQLDALSAQQGEQAAALRRSLLELNNQLEALRAELATLRGANEQLARTVAELQRGQRDVVTNLDERLRKVEPVRVTVDGREFLADPEEKRAFEAALAQLRGGEFDRAIGALQGFQRRWPGSGYADASRFWLGNALYGKRDYKEAIATFRAFVTGAPDHPRAPEALLAIANTQAEMKDPRAARRTLDELLKAYPQSEAAAAGRERLAALPR